MCIIYLYRVYFLWYTVCVGGVHKGGHYNVLFCRDVIGCAMTGSGKTLAFALLIVHSLSNR